MVKDPDTGACQGRNIQGTDMVKDPDTGAYMVNGGWARSPAASFYVLRFPVYSSHHETPSDTSWHSSDMSGHSR